MTDASALPDLQSLTVEDGRLCGVAADARAVRDAVAAGRAVLAEAGSEGDAVLEQRLLGYVGNAHRLLGETDKAEAALRRSLDLAERLGNRRAAVVARVRLGDALRCGSDLAAAEAMLSQAAAEAEQTAPDLHDFALQHLGKCLLNRGDLAGARVHLEQALALRTAKGDAALVASTEAALAQLAPGSHEREEVPEAEAASAGRERVERPEPANREGGGSRGNHGFPRA